MPPKATRASRDDAALDAQGEGAADAGNVAVEPLGELDDPDQHVGRRAGNADALDELAGREILLAVAQEEILEREGAALGSAPERELGAQRDQRRRHVADRRAVGDIAADRAGVADLDSADAADELAEIRMQAGQRLAGLGVADGRPERERLRALLDLPQIGDVADEDGRAEVAKLLGDPQADVGGPGDDPGLGMRDEEVGQLVGAGRMAVSGPQRAERPDGGLVILGRHRHGFARREDRAVAGAAAQIAGDDVAHRARPKSPPRRGFARRATSRSRACRSRIASRGARPARAGPGDCRPGAGLRDRVNQHYLSTFGAAAAVGLITGSASSSAPLASAARMRTEPSSSPAELETPPVRRAPK